MTRNDLVQPTGRSPEPELSIDWQVDTSTDLRAIPFGVMIAADIDTSDDRPAAVERILNWLVFEPSTDTMAEIWAWAVDTDTEDGRDAAAAERFFDLGTHFLLSYSTGAVARYVLDRYRDHMSPLLALKTAVFAVEDPRPGDQPGLAHDTEDRIRTFVNSSEGEWHSGAYDDLTELVAAHDIDLPAPTPVRCPPPGDGHDMEGCGAIVTGGHDFEGIYDCPACGLFFNADEAAPIDRKQSASADSPLVVTVDVPAEWVGLLAYGRHDGTRDDLGRPVRTGAAPSPADPYVYDDDIRDYAMNDALRPEVGFVPAVRLWQKDNRYFVAPSAIDDDRLGDDDWDLLWPFQEGHPANGRLAPTQRTERNMQRASAIRDLLASDTLQSLVGGRTVTLVDGRAVRYDIRLVWRSPNTRLVAINAVKRTFQVSKTVAARVVDEARFDLIDIADPSPAEVVGSVAVGWMDPAVVASLAVDFGPERSVAEVPVHGPRPKRCVVTGLDRGSRMVVLAGGDWRTVTVDGEVVESGLPESGGPNPVTAAKRIARLLG